MKGLPFFYRDNDNSIEKIFSAKKENTVVLAAGEPVVEVTKSGGTGGRTLHMALTLIDMNIIDDDSVFLPFASDGIDNSDAAGAIIDKNTTEKLRKLKKSTKYNYPIIVILNDFSDDLSQINLHPNLIDSSYIL